MKIFENFCDENFFFLFIKMFKDPSVPVVVSVYIPTPHESSMK